jgi:hypothetical protein
MRKKINLTLIGVFISYSIYLILELAGYFKKIEFTGAKDFDCHYLDKQELIQGPEK